MTENKNPWIFEKEIDEKIKVHVQEQADGTWDIRLGLMDAIAFTVTGYPDQATARSEGIRLANDILSDEVNQDDPEVD